MANIIKNILKIIIIIIIFLNSGMLTIQTTAKKPWRTPQELAEVRQHRRGLGRGLRSGRPRSGELHPVPRPRRGFHGETTGNSHGVPMGIHRFCLGEIPESWMRNLGDGGERWIFLWAFHGFYRGKLALSRFIEQIGLCNWIIRFWYRNGLEHAVNLYKSRYVNLYKSTFFNGQSSRKRSGLWSNPAEPVIQPAKSSPASKLFGLTTLLRKNVLEKINKQCVKQLVGCFMYWVSIHGMMRICASNRNVFGIFGIIINWSRNMVGVG